MRDAQRLFRPRLSMFRSAQTFLPRHAVRSRHRARVLLFLLAVGAVGGCAGARAAPDPVTAAISTSAGTTEYVLGPATLDGIGKYYLGREISQVMGHLGAGWLERDTREAEERTDLLIDFLRGQGGRIVADIGAGTGYFSFPWAAHLEVGEVLAVDIQPEMLEIVNARAASMGVRNVRPVLGAIDDPRLPEGVVDVVLIVDAYHEFSHPREMIQGIARALSPDGRLVLVEYRGEDPFVPIKDLHRMTEAQAIREMEAAGLEWVETEDFLPMQHVMVFRKRPGA